MTVIHLINRWRNAFACRLIALGFKLMSPSQRQIIVAMIHHVAHEKNIPSSGERSNRRS